MSRKKWMSSKRMRCRRCVANSFIFCYSDVLHKPSKSTRSRRPSLKAAEAAAHSRKRKGSSLSAPSAPKRRAGPSQRQPESMEGPVQEALPPVGEEFSFQVRGCLLIASQLMEQNDSAKDV